MVTHSVTVPEVENTQVRGRDTSPRRMTKALTAAIRRRDMMIRTGASAENIAVIDARIARLGGTVTPITDAPTATAKPAETPDERIRRLMTARLAVIDAKRAKVEALRAELAAAEADLARTVEVAATAPLIEGVTPLIEDMSDETASEQEGSASPAAEDTNPFTVARERAEAEARARADRDAEALAVLGDGFAPYEPAHVLAVAEGAPARWVRGDDGRWYVAARADQVMEGRWVEVHRADGSVSVELLSGAVVATEMGGVWVAVCSVVPDTKVVA